MSEEPKPCKDIRKLIADALLAQMKAEPGACPTFNQSLMEYCREMKSDMPSVILLSILLSIVKHLEIGHKQLIAQAETAEFILMAATPDEDTKPE